MDEGTEKSRGPEGSERIGKGSALSPDKASGEGSLARQSQPGQENGKQGKSKSRGGIWMSVADTTSRLGLILLLCGAAFLLTGFVRFSNHVTAIKADNLASMTATADGIVVLTGGKDRISEALKLFEAGKAKRLLISGVHPKTSQKAILHVAKADGSSFDCCVDLDHLALDTIGNAEQAAVWAKTNGFQSLIVVTSAYHMPRSMLEMRARMPDVAIKPYHVRYGPFEADNWIKNPETLKVVMSEYVKYMAASLRSRFRSDSANLQLAEAAD